MLVALLLSLPRLLGFPATVLTGKKQESNEVEEKLKYEEARKVLNLYRELTDPEIIWLIYYSLY